MGSVILGTAGHIDHGKTALVRALTGTDTDRLKEEKARGITIELGFAELAIEGGPHFGVVDVPGHEAFVRAMVAGAAGMDVVLLVVAADEGVMPQTREHLSIIELLGVRELVVALTKSDTVDEEWLELADSDVEDTLSGTPYELAPRIATSSVEGTGLDELRTELVAAAGRALRSGQDDLTRLPLDRVFTIQGTGTVVTGSLWTGALSVGDKVRILPQDLDARVRGLQVHGRSAPEASAGDRTAVALTGGGADRDVVSRGSTLVTSSEWAATWMLTARVQVLADSEWSLAHNQRLHVHHGTAEVLARCALLEPEELMPGESGWVQLRLEQPIVARARDRFVIRAYSPVATIGGGIVAEPNPPKRNRLSDSERAALSDILDADDDERAVRACLEIASWGGVLRSRLPIQSGLSVESTRRATASMEGSGVFTAIDHVFADRVRVEAEELILKAVEAGHVEDSLRVTVPLPPLRAALPSWAPQALAEAVIDGLVRADSLEAAEGGVRTPGYRPELTSDQEAAYEALLSTFVAEGLAPPLIEELPLKLRNRKDFWPLVRRLEGLGMILQVADGLYVGTEELDAAAGRIMDGLGGQTALGPSAFREALPVTRKHLIPLLNYFDGRGTTIRHEGGRDVPTAP